MGEKRKSAPVAVAMIIACAVTVPVLYVLSIGPAFRAVHYGQLDYEVYGLVYSPVTYAANASSTFADLLNWYGELWRPPDR